MVKKIYKTMQGKEIDLDALMMQNETVAAVGNIKVNARGDEIGEGGKIIRRKEDIVNQFYNDQSTKGTK